jgi:hypothetical protein
MRRRDLVPLIGAALRPFVSHAQQKTIPVPSAYPG